MAKLTLVSILLLIFDSRLQPLFCQVKSYQDSLIVHDILSHIQVKEFDKFLIVSKRICNDCVEDAFLSIKESDKGKAIGIIYVGEDVYSTKRRNVIARGKLLFLPFEEKFFSDLEAKNKPFAWKVIAGVQKVRNGYEIEYGGNLDVDVKLRMGIVLKFLGVKK
jgi:hypothetical protein